MDRKTVDRLGLTRLSSPESDQDANVDIVFVHGLFGHPYDTWTSENANPTTSTASPIATALARVNGEAVSGRKTLSKISRSLRKHIWSKNERDASQTDDARYDSSVKTDVAIPVSSAPTQTQGGDKCDDEPPHIKVGSHRLTFWPHDLLIEDMPLARIFTWGYDADIAIPFSFASQSSIFQHATQLLSDLADERTLPIQQTRPIIFVAHSLGGLIVKDALNTAHTNKKSHLHQLLPAVAGICFLGTPHRGSSTASLGKIAFNISRLAYTHANVGILASLERNADTLERIGDGFAVLLSEKMFKVHSFRETLPTNGVMVVENYSSKIGFAEEGQGEIPANHWQMTRYASARDQGYKRVVGVLKRWVTTIVEKHDADLESELMRTLRSEETHFRIKAVEPNYRGTLEWLFTQKLSFSKWLASNKSGIFWIQGKPGSGKSTAMKFAMKSEQTRLLLRKSGAREWLISGYFFYDRGSVMQKSIQGLLTEIVSDLLSQRRDLIKFVLPIYKKKLQQICSTELPTQSIQSIVESDQDTILSSDFRKSPPRPKIEWDTESLLDALRAIFTGSMGLNLCLFIDALDEHHGAHGNLLDMLHELLQVSQSKQNRLKLCVASRPEAIFVERLRSCAGLRMQDHTESDILTYTRNRLSAEVSQHRLRKKDAFFKNIVEHIANSAQGVFIWVRLVMDELIEAIQQGDDYQSLIELIQEVPEELDDLYIHAIKRMASKRNSSGSRRLRYIFESYCMFQIALCARSPYGLFEFMDIVRESVPAFYILARAVSTKTAYDSRRLLCRQFPSSHSLQDMHAVDLNPTEKDSVYELSLRLTSRSAGLLEHVSTTDSFRFNEVGETESTNNDRSMDSTDVVQFIHQTAKESIEKVIKGASLTAGLPDHVAGVSGHQILVAYHLGQIMSGEVKPLAPFLYHAWHVETLQGICVDANLDKLQSTVVPQWFLPSDDEGLPPDFNGDIIAAHCGSATLIGIAAASGLHLSVEALTGRYLANQRFEPKALSILILKAMESCISRWPDGKGTSEPRTLSTILRGSDCQDLAEPMESALHLCFLNIRSSDMKNSPGYQESWRAILETLLQFGMNPDALLGPVIPPLKRKRIIHHAIEADALELTQLLLEMGADPHLESGDGETALTLALKTGNINMISLVNRHLAHRSYSSPSHVN
ncbi:hypothetical protein LTR41_000668 [Exophiala xenobiotica]|nr:hypothetical protein LTR41_000668 [Exophiala xenobiotica]